MKRRLASGWPVGVHPRTPEEVKEAQVALGELL